MLEVSTVLSRPGRSLPFATYGSPLIWKCLRPLLTVTSANPEHVSALAVGQSHSDDFRPPETLQGLSRPATKLRTPSGWAGSGVACSPARNRATAALTIT